MDEEVSADREQWRRDRQGGLTDSPASVHRHPAALPRVPSSSSDVAHRRIASRALGTEDAIAVLCPVGPLSDRHRQRVLVADVDRVPPAVAEGDVRGAAEASEAGLLAVLRLEWLLGDKAGKRLSLRGRGTEVKRVHGRRGRDGLDASVSVDRLLEVAGRGRERERHVGQHGERGKALRLEDEFSLLSLEILNLLLQSDLEKKLKSVTLPGRCQPIRRRAYLLGHRGAHLAPGPPVRSCGEAEEGAHAGSARSCSSVAGVVLSPKASSSGCHLLHGRRSSSRSKLERRRQHRSGRVDLTLLLGGCEGGESGGGERAHLLLLLSSGRLLLSRRWDGRHALKLVMLLRHEIERLLGRMEHGCVRVGQLGRDERGSQRRRVLLWRRSHATWSGRRD